MKANWSPLKSELAIWRHENHILPVWWRDDDAVKETDALKELFKMSADLTLPVHLAVIPKAAQSTLVARCENFEHVVPVVHGWAHQNHAPGGSKKAEFGHPRDAALSETADALTQMRNMFGAELLEMFVPPWNRLDGSVTNGLAAQGYTMVSTYTPRVAAQLAGLIQINTHIDPINWRGGGGLVDPDTVIAGIVQTLQDRRSGVTDITEPLGFLTHHLVHDPAIWAFTRACLSVLLEGGAMPCNLQKMDLT